MVTPQTYPLGHLHTHDDHTRAACKSRRLRPDHVWLNATELRSIDRRRRGDAVVTALTRHERCALSYIHDRRAVAVRAQPARHARAVRVCVRDAHARERSTSRPSFKVHALLTRAAARARASRSLVLVRPQARRRSRRQLPQRRDYSQADVGQPAPEGETDVTDYLSGTRTRMLWTSTCDAARAEARRDGAERSRAR